MGVGPEFVAVYDYEPVFVWGGVLVGCMEEGGALLYFASDPGVGGDVEADGDACAVGGSGEGLVFLGGAAAGGVGVGGVRAVYCYEMVDACFGEAVDELS